MPRPTPLHLSLTSVVFSFAIMSHPVSAALTPQQQLYKETLKAAETGDAAAVKRGLAKLDDYPLKPYIIYAGLRANLKNIGAKEVLEFSERYADTPLEGRLRWALTSQLGQRKDWQAFRTLYSTLNNPSVEQQCYMGRAYLAADETSQAYDIAGKLWVEGHSQPDSCDPLFERWIKDGKITDRHVVKRVLSALDEGNLSLARYAARKAGEVSTTDRIERAIEIYRNPRSLLDNPGQVTRGSEDHRRLLLLAVNRLRRSDLDAAITLWIRDRDRLDIPIAEQAELSVRMGTLKAKHYDADSERTLARLDPEYTLAELTEWRARLALKRLDWPEVEKLIQQLPPNKRRHERWQYWLSMAQKQQGQNVKKQLQALSSERTFYGFLAAELSQAPFSLNHEPIVIDTRRLNALESTPAFQRMHELYQLNELYEARSEWNNATHKLSTEEQHLASHVVKRWGWNTQAIRGAIQSEQWNDLEIRFPDPYPAYFDAASERAGITNTWATAIARQESAFWESARSRAGALGLMQLMPNTARQTAKRHDLPLGNLVALYDPQTNINLGSAYLGEMFREFGSNRVYATAAYNAGPHRVRTWIKERGRLPLDIWIETIPFDETRNYVQNVLSFSVIYDRLANRPARLLSDSEKELLAFNQLNGGQPDGRKSNKL